MNWVAPVEKDHDNSVLEKRLWAAADPFRANSELKLQEYFDGRPLIGPALGLIFLRFAAARFVAKHKQNPSAELSLHGVEKTEETGCLFHMNLAVIS